MVPAARSWSSAGVTDGGISVMRARPGEVDAVVALLDEAARWHLARGIEQWRPGMFPADFIASAVERGEVHVARRDSAIVGTMTVLWIDPAIWPDVPADDGAYVHRLAVRRAFTGTGVGLRLLERAEEIARGAGRRWLRLDCVATGTALRAYYERAGFVYRDDVDFAGYRLSRYAKPL
jgi:GNAT superfamily N-acetyltransferase